MNITPTLMRLISFIKGWKYPYIYELKLGSVSANFHVNSAVEEYRVNKWGGEKDFVKYMIKQLRSDDIFFDVGSSIGLHSILSASKIKKGKVYSFEPDPKIVVRLSENVSLNKLKNLVILPMALSDKKGYVRLYSEGPDNNSPSLKPVQGFKRFVRVESDSIDDLIRTGRLPYPSSIKIDAEGAEGLVLDGMKKLLRSKKRPGNIFIEVHYDYLPKFGSGAEKVLLFLNTNKYKLVKVFKLDNQDIYHFTG